MRGNEKRVWRGDIVTRRGEAAIQNFAIARRKKEEITMPWNVRSAARGRAEIPARYGIGIGALATGRAGAIEHLGTLGRGGEWRNRWLGGGSVFLGFAVDGAVEGRARIGEAWRSGPDVGWRRLRIGTRGRSGFEEGLKRVGHCEGRGAKGMAVIEQPAGEQGFGLFFNPLIDQGCNFAAQIGRVIQSRKFKTFQGCRKCFAQIFERRNGFGQGHRWSSGIWFGRKKRARVPIDSPYLNVTIRV